MIIVHHLNNSRSQRVLWLLEELGVDCEIKKYERDPKTMLAPLVASSDFGPSPIVMSITVSQLLLNWQICVSGWYMIAASICLPMASAV